MNGLRASFCCAALLAAGQIAHAQMTSSEARAEGEALGEGARDSTSDSILASGAEAEVPTYGGTDFPHLDYVEDPVGLSTAGEAQRYADDYRTVVDPYRTTFDPTTIDLSSAQAIEADPDTYLGPGGGRSGASGTCDPLLRVAAEPRHILKAAIRGLSPMMKPGPVRRHSMSRLPVE